MREDERWAHNQLADLEPRSLHRPERILQPVVTSGPRLRFLVALLAAVLGALAWQLLK